VGLQDRDYMRDRNRSASENEPPFRPPAERQSLLLMILWWLGIAYILFKMFGWWQEKNAVRSPVVPVAPSIQQLPYVPPTVVVAPARPETPSVERPSLPPRQTHAAPAPEPRVIESLRPQTGGTIYHCKNYSGGTFWAQAHCAQHNALIDRIANVPAGLPFEQQVNIAEQQRQAAARNIAVQSAPVPQAVPSNKAECQSLDQRVEHLDAMARQPQSGQMQDWIRGERQKARDRQFALRC
jgi:hypothetical protein